ncbi:hypothetical protein NMY22_g4225 [Coprinellus aureogranulatus]|nr:hypothetical protein NMY22_g4225 [Coprinellus aureogranulatus]
MSSAPPAIPQPQPITGASDSPNPRDTQLTDDRPLSYATAADDTNIVSGEATNRDDGSVSPNAPPMQMSAGPFPEPVVEESEGPIDDAATDTERPSRPGMSNRRSTFDNDRRSMFSTASGVTAADTQTKYVNMLLALDHIHPINNMLAFVFCWLLLAGFAVLPGTLRKTIPSFIQDQVNDEQVKEALSLLVQHVPLVAVAGSVSGVGLIGMVTMWIRWRGNYIWLIRNIFLPGCTNALAGLVSTLVSIFVLNSGQLDTLSIVVLSVVGGTTVFNLLMIIIYQFIMLGGLQREHQQQVGKHSAGKTGAAPRALLATRGHDDLATAVPACVVGGSLFYGDSNLFAGFSMARHVDVQWNSLALIGVTNMTLSPLAQYHHIEDLTIQDVRPSAASSVATGACFPLNCWALMASRLPAKSAHASKLSLTAARCGEALKTLLVCAADSEATLPLLRPWALALGTSGFDRSMQEAWSSLLVRCSASVVKYTLNQDESRHEFFHPPTLPAFVPISLPLSRFENLQHVHIWMTYDHFRSSEFQVLPHLARELKDIAAGKAARMPSELSHISFTINLNAIRITYLRTAALVVANRGTWNEVNALLSSPAFARMKRLGLQYEAELGIIHDVAFWRIAREVLWKQLGDLKRKCAVVVGLTRLENVA